MAELTKRESKFIAASNIMIGVLVFIDLLVITEIISVDLPLLTLVNLVGTLIALYQFRLKRRVRLLRKASASQPFSSPQPPSQAR